ncbi:DUF1904 family protein [Brevibacillus fluminis]|uniref:DUF1904 family protein n=1 Tax=Brevibacillus fluminis TaxID=511487 RepID=A0A3M8D7I7_9BACL|nr:DUF1904 family protein [Brevibacillus fluminis]RNB83357.1 DUF1904 family protein [Brevibacillus fluminis]
MPFLRFKGFDKEKLTAVAPQMIERFAAIAHIPEEIVKLELLMVEAINKTPLSLEIFMFQREQQVHDAIAAMMNQLLEEHGFANVHIFFIILNPSLYYKQGQPLKEVPRLPVPHS